MLTVILGLLLPARLCLSHAVSHRTLEGGVGIEATYDDGSPVSYSEVKIYSPEDREREFQHGYTDRNGRFVFFPDDRGGWKVVVNDGMGHGLVTEIDLEGGIAGTPEHPVRMRGEETTESGFSRWRKIVNGVSLIWGFTGVLFYLAAKKRYGSG